MFLAFLGFRVLRVLRDLELLGFRVSAPQHNGHPTAAGELYPGFPDKHEKFCAACDQLRRRFVRAAKPHCKPACEWALLQGKRSL